MRFVIQDSAGYYYAGYEIDHAIWFRGCREDCKLEEPIADAVLRQLTAMGYTGLSKNKAPEPKIKGKKNGGA